MPRRTLPGIGTVDLTEEEDVLCRRILANESLDPQAAANEVAFLVELSGAFNAAPFVPDGEEDTWAAERVQARVERETAQQVLA